MKALVGVDLGDMYVPALRLCLRLGFPNLSLELIHAVEPLPQTTPPLGPIGVGAVGWMEELREAGDKALERAKTLVPQGVSSKTDVVEGSAAGSLISRGDESNADLIAVGAIRQDRLSTLLFGSVSRALATGSHQSVLVAKGDIAEEGALNLVFATDHSDYANRSLDRFLSWAPKGVRKVTVVTAFEMDDASIRMLGKEVEGASDAEIEAAVKTNLEGRGEEAAGKLRSAGYEATAIARNGHANRVLPAAMAEAKADVLAMGAQGHGFLERLFIGSNSLHQVMNESYPVLVIRA